MRMISFVMMMRVNECVDTNCERGSTYHWAAVLASSSPIVSATVVGLCVPRERDPLCLLVNVLCDEKVMVSVWGV